MLNSLLKKREYVDWQDYEQMINTLDTLAWQQHVRKLSLKNVLENESIQQRY